MDIWEPGKLLLFLGFFVPGFISMKVYDLLVPGERRDFSKSLFDAIGYSTLNLAVFSWVIIPAYLYLKHPWITLALMLTVLVIAPALWPWLLVHLSSWPPIARHIVSPIAKPWDYVFGRRQVTWVIIHLKDGRKIGGKYDTNSFVTSYPVKEQIYLQEVWELSDQGAFVAPVRRSQGIIVLGDEILAVEFFK